MKIGTGLTIFSQIINFAIFIYFAVILIKSEKCARNCKARALLPHTEVCGLQFRTSNSLEVGGLLISAFGLLSSLVANIISVLEENQKKTIKDSSRIN